MTPEDKKVRRLVNGFAREDREFEEHALGELLESVHGRRFLWWLLEITGPLRTQFNAESERATVFNLGQQNVGLQLLSRITEKYPQKYLTMLEEMHNVREQRTNAVNGAQ